jgi:hypothetical protein
MLASCTVSLKLDFLAVLQDGIFFDQLYTRSMEGTRIS